MLRKPAVARSDEYWFCTTCSSSLDVRQLITHCKYIIQFNAQPFGQIQIKSRPGFAASATIIRIVRTKENCLDNTTVAGKQTMHLVVDGVQGLDVEFPTRQPRLVKIGR